MPHFTNESIDRISRSAIGFAVSTFTLSQILRQLPQEQYASIRSAVVPLQLIGMFMIATWQALEMFCRDRAPATQLEHPTGMTIMGTHPLQAQQQQNVLNNFQQHMLNRRGITSPATANVRTN